MDSDKVFPFEVQDLKSLLVQAEKIRDEVLDENKFLRGMIVDNLSDSVATEIFDRLRKKDYRFGGMK